MPAVGFLNAVNPTCAVNVCLQQVAGLLENQPVLYEACTSAFGAPVTTTFTVDSIVSTTTVPGETFTDVFVTLTVSTHSETEEFTDWHTVSSTATQTSTVVVTETSTVTVPYGSKLKARSNPRRRKRDCIPRTTEIPTTSPVPVPTNCADVAEFSSACKCIDAVSDAPTVTVTVTEPTTTNIVTLTQDVWTLSTEIFTEHEVTWTSITHTLTTTQVATTTVTVTSTAHSTVVETAVPTVLTGKLRADGGGVSQWLSRTIFGTMPGQTVRASGETFTFPNGGQPYRTSDTRSKIYAVWAAGADYASLGTASSPVAQDYAFVCQIGQNKSLACTAGPLTDGWRCGTTHYMSKPGFNLAAALNNAACVRVEWWVD
ncbi:hypothetical protein VTJ04DRAFT_7262 [Mycothermus thermophilus]|uniref:uncharacterized protein n=1 Tax=Humicola insolens TaxID=85995 RepID=UPI0037446BD9